MFEFLLRLYNWIRCNHPVYFFHHMPKCGGTSVRVVLHEWFYVNTDYHNEAKNDAPPINLFRATSKHCITGHFGHNGYFIRQRYPKVFNGLFAKRRYRVFTFIREPLAMRCSLYRHQLLKNENPADDLFKSIMTVNNYYARIFGVDESNWRESLDKYFFIGLSDDLQFSFDLLADLIDKPKANLVRENTTRIESDSSEKSLSEEQIEEFKNANQLDYQIYNYVKQRLEQAKNTL